MNELMQFGFEGHQVRIVMRDGKPWWVAADVCDILGIGRPQDSVRYLDEDEKGRCLVDTPSGQQEMLVVNEPGLYSLILRSRKPEAKAFKRWVTHEVLPQIRRTGSYSVHGRYGPTTEIGGFPVPTTYVGALRLAADLAEENERQRERIRELEPKAEFHDRVASSRDAMSIREAAKLLGTGQNRLFAWLRGQRILMADNQPYQEYLDAGYFRVIEQTWTDRQGNVHLATKTLVTGKGLAWLQKRWDAYHRPERALRVVETASHQ
ncbi:phage antirepressor KilAC domain-containing protein [Symbiobacterium thermophilum]|uniref:Phage antirepressor Ant n=1 Tax=Symbiobacterium thermophilum TaxID=2734 RepID=A0A953ID31_SYMTR|nr:phage antirepressor KilAC domain-containing protein [Symbiobacterium thermophilum]MBY6278579.1 phage antirepressor Ant [Symbiobacterium thermophilum]